MNTHILYYSIYIFFLYVNVVIFFFQNCTCMYAHRLKILFYGQTYYHLFADLQPQRTTLRTLERRREMKLNKRFIRRSDRVRFFLRRQTHRDRGVSSSYYNTILSSSINRGHHYNIFTTDIDGGSTVDECSLTRGHAPVYYL